MLSQLTDANISDINSSNWVAQYTYKKNGDMASRTIQGTTTDFTYDGHLMDTATGGDVVNTYTYEPFGEEYPTEANETVDNSFRFAGL